MTTKTNNKIHHNQCVTSQLGKYKLNWKFINFLWSSEKTLAILQQPPLPINCFMLTDTMLTFSTKDAHIHQDLDKHKSAY